MIIPYDQLIDVFTKYTFDFLGVDYDTLTDPQKDLIRVKMQEESSPFNEIDVDTVYLWARFTDDEINRQVLRSPKSESLSNSSVVSVDWTFYGPNAFTLGKSLRLELFSYESQYYWTKNRFGLITDIPEAIYMFEPFSGRNWPRADLTARFNYVDSLDMPVPGFKGDIGIQAWTEKGLYKVINVPIPIVTP
jgi:hypothetical protein